MEYDGSLGRPRMGLRALATGSGAS